MTVRPTGSLNASVALASALLTIAALEGGFRWGGYDLSGKRRALEARPIFYRQPTVPVGTVFFRRPGRVAWTGNVLSTGLRAGGWQDADPYEHGGELTITYDHQGFRNADDLERWQVCVVGDSFTELGHLAQEDLFTTRAAELLKVPVRNVGVSHTGPLTHLFYLREYCPSPDLRHAVLAFFEGNDIGDLMREQAAVRRFEQSGHRDFRTIEKQTSLLRHLQTQLTTMRASRKLPARPAPAGPRVTFSTGGQEIPVSFLYPLPSLARVGPGQRRALSRVLADWAAAARHLGAAPWMLYLPVKRRVLHDRLRFPLGASEPPANRRAAGLPLLMRELAASHGVGFVDPTSALVAETARGRLTYNTIWDTHLNREGASIVGRVLAEAVAHQADRTSSADR